MPLAGPTLCSFPDCKNIGRERHHIVYSSENRDKHFYCRKNKRGNTSEFHGDEIVPLCRFHHQAITDYNERMWKVNRYQALSCHQRRHYWKLFLNGESPPGVTL